MDTLILFIATILVNALAVWLAAKLLPGVSIRGYGSAVAVALVLALLNVTIRPLLVILTLPVTILTLGLFLIVIAGFVLKIADWLIGGFRIRNFWWAMGMAVVLGVINIVLLALIPGL